jgi:hypothetical protein
MSSSIQDKHLFKYINMMFYLIIYAMFIVNLTLKHVFDQGYDLCCNFSNIIIKDFEESRFQKKVWKV